jgi:hypothetical protein
MIGFYSAVPALGTFGSRSQCGFQFVFHLTPHRHVAAITMPFVTSKN